MCIGTSLYYNNMNLCNMHGIENTFKLINQLTAYFYCMLINEPCMYNDCLVHCTPCLSHEKIFCNAVLVCRYSTRIKVCLDCLPTVYSACMFKHTV